MAKSWMLLYGKNSIHERLKCNPRSIRKIFLKEQFSEPQIEALIKEKSVSCERIPSKRLSNMRQSKDLQGIVARVERFRYAEFEDILKEGEATFLFLDRISDPQNLGVILRSAACLGEFAVVIPGFRACEVTETVLHVAQGGENYVPVVRVTNLKTAILCAKKSGYWIMGGVCEDAQDVDKTEFLFPLGFVLGSEGEGIRYGIRKHLDKTVRIPMSGSALSLNVAMACGIFCHEISKQRKK